MHRDARTKSTGEGTRTLVVEERARGSVRLTSATSHEASDAKLETSGGRGARRQGRSKRQKASGSREPYINAYAGHRMDLDPSSDAIRETSQIEYYIYG